MENVSADLVPAVASPRDAYDTLRMRNSADVDLAWKKARAQYLTQAGIPESDAQTIASAELDTAYLGDVVLDADFLQPYRKALRDCCSSFS